MPLAAPDILDGIQSVLAPTGPDAAGIATLSWALFIGGGLIFLLVMALTAWALIAPPASRRWLADRMVVVLGGIAFPVVVLSILLVYGLVLAAGMVREQNEGSLAVDVVGHRYWWEVNYPGPAGPALVTANEIHIPTGRPVRFSLTSADVIHSFWVPKLGGKLDMIPGRTNTLTLQADVPGVFRGQCTEFCGGPHALMAFFVVAHEPADFERWFAEQRRPQPEPAAPFLKRGQELFASAGCGSCHAVSGTAADGRVGPDLTHVGSRRSLGAGILPNNQGTLAGWIADVQHLKPGAYMPSYDVLAGEDLRAVAAYLESLK